MPDFVKDKNAAIVWARQMLETGCSILDTETTGLGNTAEVVQIAVLSKTEAFQCLVIPTVPITDGAKAVHGISMEHCLQHGKPITEVMPKVEKTIGSYPLVIYNIGYDTKVLEQSLRARGDSLKLFLTDPQGQTYFRNGERVHCAMQYYAQFVGEWNYKYKSYRWQKLVGGDHSALGDCQATMQVIKQMAETDLIDTIPF